MNKCLRCKRAAVRKHAPGRLRTYCTYCRKLVAAIRRTKTRRARRLAAKLAGVPTWRRNGWRSIEAHRAYMREYMRRWRARRRKTMR